MYLYHVPWMHLRILDKVWRFHLRSFTGVFRRNRPSTLPLSIPSAMCGGESRSTFSKMPWGFTSERERVVKTKKHIGPHSLSLFWSFGHVWRRWKYSDNLLPAGLALGQSIKQWRVNKSGLTVIWKERRQQHYCSKLNPFGKHKKRVYDDSAVLTLEIDM